VIVLSFGVGPCLHLAFVRDNDGVRLQVQVGDDQVADVALTPDDLVALHELVEAV
jgi:hypothetical protein